MCPLKVIKDFTLINYQAEKAENVSFQQGVEAFLPQQLCQSRKGRETHAAQVGTSGLGRSPPVTRAENTTTSWEAERHQEAELLQRLKEVKEQRSEF